MDSSRTWVRVRRASRGEVLACVENHGKLWINGHSTRNGYHDEMPLEEANQLSNSLVFISAPKVRLRVLAPGHDFGNPVRRVQGFFSHGGVKYGLRVTDLQIEGEYLKRNDGIYELDESFIAVSVSEPFHKSNGAGFRYKLIAAIIESAALEEDS